MCDLCGDVAEETCPECLSDLCIACYSGHNDELDELDD